MGASSSSSSQVVRRELSPLYTVIGTVTSGMNVVEKIAADGNSVAADNGVPPKVTHHMISVTIQQISA